MRVKRHLVQRLASSDLEVGAKESTPMRRARGEERRRRPKTHHGVDMLCLDDAGVKEDRLAVVVLHELLHLGREVGERVATDGVDAHRLGEGDEVGVRHLGVRVALLVEEI